MSNDHPEDWEVKPGVYAKAKDLPHCNATTADGWACSRYGRYEGYCGQHARSWR